MQRVALYIRVSTDEQALRGDSLETQGELLASYAKNASWEVVGRYIDDGYTAAKLKRPALQQLLEDVRQDKIDLILFTKLDRWFRNVRDYYKIQDILEQHHVHWKTVLENYDTTTSAGRLHINIMLSVAEDEVSRTSERIKVVFESKIHRGEVIFSHFPLGLKAENKRVVHDEGTVGIVRDLFAHYEMHRSKYALAIYAREQYGLHLSGSTVSRLLSNTLYKGEYRGIPSYCPPVIAPEHFDRVQEILKENIRKAPSRRIYLFTGLLTCAECGHKLISRAQHSGANFYYYYRCNHHYRQQLCPHGGVVSEKYLENILLEDAERFLSGLLADYKCRLSSSVRRPVSDKGKIQKKLANLKELYLNDLITLDSYKADYKSLAAQLEKAETDAAPAIGVLPQKRFTRLGFRAAYLHLEREGRRMFWRMIIKNIRVDKSNRNFQIFYV